MNTYKPVRQGGGVWTRTGLWGCGGSSITPSLQHFFFSVFHGLIAGEVLALPDLLGGCGVVGGGPERMGGGEAEWEEGGGTEVEAAGGDVGFGEGGLVSGEAEGEPAAGGEGAGGVEGSLENSGEGGADLRGGQGVGEIFPQGLPGEEVEGAGAVAEGSADGREGAVGGDLALLDDGVTAGAVENAVAELREVLEGFDDVGEHGVDDVAVVVVAVEFGSVAVNAVAEIPLFVLAEGVIDAHAVCGFADGFEEGFDEGGEEQPVVKIGDAIPGGAETRENFGASGVAEGVPEGRSAPEKALGEEGGVDHALLALGEIDLGGEVVESGDDIGQEAVTEGGFFRGKAGTDEPGGDAAEGAADGFEVRKGFAFRIGVWRGFDRHVGAEALVCE